MAITQVGFHVLSVGQGNGTFVVYYDNGKPVDAAIMDFGSDVTTFSTSKYAAVGWAETLFKAMGKGRKLAAVFLSHSDYDHISMLKPMLELYPGGRAQLPVGKVWYGGAYANYTKGRDKFNVLDLLEEYTPAGSGKGEDLPADGTSFSGAKAAPLLVRAPVTYYLLIGNTASLHTTSVATRSGYFKNTESLVVVADCAGRQFVMAGDATGATMFKANTVVKGSKAARAHLTDVFHATVPHHGSYNSASVVQYFGGDWKAILTEFVGNLKAKSISASAGVENKHEHPSAAILEFFWRNPALTTDKYEDPALAGTGRHYFTAYFDPATPVGAPSDDFPVGGSAYWGSMQTAKSVFTTDYWQPLNDHKKIVPPTPVQGAPAVKQPAPARPTLVHWEMLYDVAKKTVRITPVPPAKAVLALGRAIIEGGPLPEVPDWTELLTAARATGVSMTLPAPGAAPEPDATPDRT